MGDITILTVMIRPSYTFLTIQDTLVPIDETVERSYENGKAGEAMWQCGHGKYSETEINQALADKRIAEISPSKSEGMNVLATAKQLHEDIRNHLVSLYPNHKNLDYALGTSYWCLQLHSNRCYSASVYNDDGLVEDEPYVHFSITEYDEMGEIARFGGKVESLVQVDLINRLTMEHPEEHNKPPAPCLESKRCSKATQDEGECGCFNTGLL